MVIDSDNCPPDLPSWIHIIDVIRPMASSSPGLPTQDSEEPMIIEVAHAIIRSKRNSKLKKFFLRIKARRGTKIGVVALARKVLCILHHLLISQELYQDDLLGKPRCVKHFGVHSTTSMSLDEMIRTIVEAGYEVRRNEYLESG